MHPKLYVHPSVIVPFTDDSLDFFYYNQVITCSRFAFAENALPEHKQLLLLLLASTRAAGMWCCWLIAIVACLWPVLPCCISSQAFYLKQHLSIIALVLQLLVRGFQQDCQDWNAVRPGKKSSNQL